MSGLSLQMISLLVMVSWPSKLLYAHPSVYYVKPTEDSPCPSTKQCSSLAQIAIQVDFAIDSMSNTTVHFLPGTHIINDTRQRFFTISNAKHIVITGSMNSSEVANVDCMGQTGFAFVNVTNLTITHLKLWHCQAHWYPYELTSKMAPYVNVTLTRTYLSYQWDATGYKSAALFFLQVVDLNITQLSLVLHEGGNIKFYGIGLLGISIFGNSIISESVFANHSSNSLGFHSVNPNGGNCIIMYTNPPTSSTIAPHVMKPTSDPMPLLASLNITKCLFTGGWSIDCNSGGLNVFLLQNQYKVNVNIDEVTAWKNGAIGVTGANMYIYDCGCTPSLVSMNNSVSTNGMGTRGVLFYYRRRHFCSLDMSQPCILTSEVVLHVANSKFTSANSRAIPVGILVTWPSCSYRMTSIVIENSVIANNTNSSLTSIGLVVSSSLAVLLKNVSFHNNSIDSSQLKGKPNIYPTTLLRIVDCHFSKNLGTPIVSVGPSVLITFQGNVTFEDNVGYNGGALYLSNVRVGFEHPLHLQFINNHAVNKGGAIYVTKPSTCRERCFFTMLEGPRDIVINGWNNTAGIAGSFLYGGSFANCETQEPSASFQIIANESDLSPISSDPILVCICQNGRPNCSITFESITAYPGQKFTVPVAVVGQKEGIVPGTVYSHIIPPESHAVLRDLQSVQEARRECIAATFSIFSSSSHEMIRLDVDPLDPDQTRVNLRHLARADRRTENPCYGLPALLVNTTLLPCPLGFELSDYPFECTCASELTNQGINCSIQTQTVYRTAQLWINATHSENGTNLIIVHKHCPLHYCKSEDINLNLSYPDEQCSFNRSGILCGKCQQNLSLVLGTSCCQKCTNTFLCLLFLFILAGFALVFLLISLNLTVAVGTINGLIFYANVLQINYSAFFSHANQSTMNKILTIFIAWLNLDLGIETCFYNGLDMYVMTWLQYAFPVYVWSIVILIIVSSHYSSFATRLSGRNAVPVLATLFLMSYAKLQRTAITVLSFTLLSLPDGSKRAVWLYDANVDYLSAIHIPLFLAAITTLICLTIPYTAVLLFAQCLQPRANHRSLFWIIRLKPVFDAYTGPYKDKCRHWTGLLLLLRTVLFIIFASNVLGDPAINLLAIAVAMSLLMVYGWNIGSVYRKRGLDLLEHSYFLNLGVVSVATLYTNSTSVSQSTAAYISATIAMVTFVGIVIYHIYMQVKTSKRSFRRCFEHLNNIQWLLLHCSRKPVQPSSIHLLSPQGSHDSDDDSPGEESSHEPTVTVIDVAALRESLLEDL